LEKRFSNRSGRLYPCSNFTLGTDEVIQQVLPHYKIDALVRRENTSRYDDRLYIQTNLIDAYDQLLSFVAKHLPDKFYIEGEPKEKFKNCHI